MKMRALTLSFLTLASTAGLLMAQSNGAEIFTVQGRVTSLGLTSPQSTIEIDPLDGQPGEVRAQAQSANPRVPAAGVLRRSGIRVGDVVTVCGVLTRTQNGTATVNIALERITLQDGGTINFVAPDTALCPPEDADLSAAPERERGIRASSAPTSPLAPPVYAPVQATPPVSTMIPATIQPITFAYSQPIRSAPLFVPGPPAGSLDENPPPPTQSKTIFPSDPFESGHLELYDRNRPATLSGQVADVQWNTPNTFIYLTVGRATWIVEASFIRFRQAWIFPGLHPGDLITVSGFYPRDNPPYDLPARAVPSAARYLRANRFIRASEIRLANGQVLDMGLPPTDAEIARRTWCYSGC